MADETPGRVAATLAAIQRDHRQHVSANFPAPGVCVSRCADSRPRWPCGAYRAASAAKAALDLADAWTDTPQPEDGGDRAAVAAEQVVLDGIELREAIGAALTGQEAPAGPHPSPPSPLQHPAGVVRVIESPEEPVNDSAPAAAMGEDEGP